MRVTVKSARRTDETLRATVEWLAEIGWSDHLTVEVELLAEGEALVTRTVRPIHWVTTPGGATTLRVRQRLPLAVLPPREILEGAS